MTTDDDLPWWADSPADLEAELEDDDDCPECGGNPIGGYCPECHATDTE